MGTLSTWELTNIICPTGGVIPAIVRLVTRIMPKCTGSIPSLRMTGSSTGVSEEVTELALELNGVIKLSGSLGALEVEPQNAVHDASIVEDLISHGFLEEAVHVVLLKSGTLIRSLLRGLVE